MTSKNINVKDRVMNDEIDLSMSDLVEIPVKDIANIRKATSLDVSNNNIKILPKNFAILTHLTKLDLSRNHIIELPENFGDLIRLRHLDLYQNELQYLPLSFYKLKCLKWLDLKNNPLKPAIAEIAGPCLDTKDCQACAKKIVTFYSKLQEKVTIETENRDKQRKKQLEINTQKEKKEKATKKKNKQKQNLNNQEIESKTTTVNKPTIQREKVKNDSIKNVKRAGNSLCSIFFVIFIIVLLLFVLTSLNYRHTELIKQNTVKAYRIGVGHLPSHYKQYGLKFGNYVYFVHEKTGNFTQSLINHVSKEEFVRLYDNTLPVISYTVNKVKNFVKDILKVE